MPALKEFQQALTEATLQAARAAVAHHAAETLYSFALYTSGDYAYVGATLSTEAGLKAVAERSLAEESNRARRGSLETASRELRWSPCDSPLHEAYADCFKAAGALLDDLWESIDEDDGQYDVTVAAVHEAMIQALVALRDSRVLPDDVVLNLLMGDQSDDERRLNSAAVNRADTHRAFLAEMAR